MDPELTRLSQRWTHRALGAVVLAWLLAGAVGAFLDAAGHHGYLTWSLALGARGGGFLFELQNSRGDLAGFALAATGLAVVSSLVGTWRMSGVARTGRPHRGPSRWSIVGVALGVVVIPNIIGCFVLSEIYGPTSDWVLAAAFAPESVGAVCGVAIWGDVTRRYDPWRWADRLRRGAPQGQESPTQGPPDPR